MFHDFRNITSSTPIWTFNSIATGTGIPIPPSPLPNRVVDRIYISNILTASFFLKGIAPAYYESASLDPTPKITHVLSLVSDKGWHERLIRKDVKSGIVQKKIVVPDRVDANLMEWFPEICKFIHTALTTTTNTQILIHCHAGISRSATAIASYLIYAHHMTFRETINTLRAARPEVNPNVGFRTQLRLWRALGCDLLEEEGREKSEYAMELWRLKIGKKDQKADLKALRGMTRPMRVRRVGGGQGGVGVHTDGGIEDGGRGMKNDKREDETWGGKEVALSPVRSPKNW